MKLRDLLDENHFRAELERQKREKEKIAARKAAQKDANQAAYQRGKDEAERLLGPYTPVARAASAIKSWAKQDMRSRSK